MCKVKWDAMAHVPLEVIPVTTLYTVFPCSIDQCVHLTSKEIWKREATRHERLWQQKQLLLGIELHGRLGVNLYFDLNRFLCLEGYVKYIRIVLQESRLHLPKVPLVFLLDFNITTDKCKLVNDGLEVLCEVESFVRCQEREIHILGKPLQSMEYA